MAKKKRKAINKKRKNPYGWNHELIGVITIGLGVFAFLSIYTSSAGLVGLWFDGLLKGLFGVVSYIMPLLIALIGIFVIMAYHKTINKIKLLLTLLFIVLGFGIVHLLYIHEFNKASLWVFISDSYTRGDNIIGSGALFSPMIYFLHKWFGIPGSYLFYIVFLVIDILLLTNLSLKQVGKNLYNKINENKLVSKERPKPKKQRNTFIGEFIPLDEGNQETLDSGLVKEHVDTEDDLISKEKSSEEELEMENVKIIDFEAASTKERNKKKEEQKTEATPQPEEHSGTTVDIQKDHTTMPYSFPPITLLKGPAASKESKISDTKVLNNVKLLEDTLESFGISAKVIQVSKGPTITRYELQPAPGIKVSRIVNLSDDIALNLAAPGVRIEAPIPGKAAVGVEVPNKDVSMVFLREVLQSNEFKNHSSKIAFALGKGIAGQKVIANIANMPHLLVAGATGSGKSVCINTIIASILFKASPDEVKLILIDPKVVELNHFNGIPHLLIPVVTDPKKAAGALNWAVQEMVDRYKKFATKGVKDLERYNDVINHEEEQKLPQIVVIVDELADLMMVAPADVEDAICRLAQMARAAGIHLVIATQRPSVDVITGLIKANIPSRIAFSVSSHTDSRTILDMGGAEKLLGRGDMLFYPVGISKPIRVQGCFVSEKEIEAVVDFIKNQYENPTYDMDIIEEIEVDKVGGDHKDHDELLPEAVEIVVDAGQASISMLQRRLRIGYARAARLIDEMEVRGIVSGFDGSKPRNVLITKDEFKEHYG